MKQFWVIIAWEFFRHFKSRSFLLSTFVSPVLFMAIILIPSLFLENDTEESPRIIGCVEFDTTSICQKIRDRLQEYNDASSNEPMIQLVSMSADTTPRLKRQFFKLASLKQDLDSLDDLYNKIKERRKYIYQKPKTSTREKLLKETYEEFTQIRESRDFAMLEYDRMKENVDSTWHSEIIHQADQMLRQQFLEGYLLVNPDDFKEGVVEFHSLLPANFLQLDPLKQALQVAIVEERMSLEGVQVDKIQQWLEPITLREIQIQGKQKKEFNLFANYLGPIIIVLFLFISIFTSSGFLFSGVLKEKTNRVIEILLSSVNTFQLIAGKIIALGALGLLQIVIWFAIFFALIAVKIVNVTEMGFLTLNNAGLFILYFILGYLFFASIFVGVGSLFSSEEDTHHLNQFMRMLSIFPVILAVIVLETPNSLLVRILSFIPPLTPTFMILRTPLGNPPEIDYYISIGIMVLSIGFSTFFAARLFKTGSLLYGKKPGIREIFRLLFKGH